jgi:hypothetical protein
MRKPVVKWVLLAAVLAVLFAGAAWALAEEDFGNAPLNEANFKEWPGVMPVVNHPSRVYHLWVNGNEQCFYQGDLAALNDTLGKFSGVPGEVVLRPGPGETHSLQGDRTIPFAWHLQMYGGIARYLQGLEGGKQVWSDRPVLTVYVGGPIELNKLEIPKGAMLLSITTVKKRTLEGLKSRDKTVRGWGAGVLTSLDPHDAESREAVTALLKDPDNWVRLNAAHSLPLFGKAAQASLPVLRENLNSPDPQLKEAAGESIRKIEAAQPQPEADRRHEELLRQIDRFVATRKG